jgi:hypothetical protein
MFNFVYNQSWVELENKTEVKVAKNKIDFFVKKQLVAEVVDADEASDV